MTPTPTARSLVAVSLKMYLSAEATRRYVARVADLATDLHGSADVEVAVLPTFPLVESTAAALAGTGVRWGAQDVAASEDGRQTGEVSAKVLAELGCTYVEIGHAERRTLFGEDRDVIDAKLAATAAAGLVPLYCLGESDRVEDPLVAAAECVADLDHALSVLHGGPVVVAYEPHWAIGADEPADPSYVRVVCTALRRRVRATSPGSRVIYGGAAGPGTFTSLVGCVDGLFLGRFAHDVDALAEVIHEVASPAPAGRS